MKKIESMQLHKKFHIPYFNSMFKDSCQSLLFLNVSIFTFEIRKKSTVTNLIANFLMGISTSHYVQTFAKFLVIINKR